MRKNVIFLGQLSLKSGPNNREITAETENLHGDAILLVPVVHINYRINFYLLGSVVDFFLLIQLRPAVY